MTRFRQSSRSPLHFSTQHPARRPKTDATWLRRDQSIVTTQDAVVHRQRVSNLLISGCSGFGGRGGRAAETEDGFPKAGRKRPSRWRTCKRSSSGRARQAHKALHCTALHCGTEGQERTKRGVGTRRKGKVGLGPHGGPCAASRKLPSGSGPALLDGFLTLKAASLPHPLPPSSPSQWPHCAVGSPFYLCLYLYPELNGCSSDSSPLLIVWRLFS